jgi:uncharacterized membrane protein
MAQIKTGLMIPDMVFACVGLCSISLAAIGPFMQDLQATAYMISIVGGIAAMVFSFLNYRINKRKSKREEQEINKNSKHE